MGLTIIQLNPGPTESHPGLTPQVSWGEVSPGFKAFIYDDDIYGVEVEAISSKQKDTSFNV